ncbi:hypothetical protein [Undibacterium sp. CY21W]|jgi:hypothetical protein|uniref:hypothetical protein n=1 Tax=Undibacterium sp. CY21W TaxID=2762293 RepID=UPI00164C9C37|nr:hypothetical protein [Undibacterium sp. CY21W]MBC3927066.1 hypothetical protein [Undibacterium sp. CY21W]
MVGIVFNPTKYNVKHKPGNGCPGTKNHFLRPNYSDEPNICLLFKHIFSQKTARNMLKTANPKSRTRNFMSPDPAMSTFFVAKQTAPTTSIWQVRVGNFLEKSSIPMLFI